MIIIMGVSGSGKTSIGKALSLQTGWPFYDADDFHSKSNKDKMKAGKSLSDSDRLPWLNDLALHIETWSNDGNAILACSALKESYRKILATKNDSIKWVYLNGSFEQIKGRLNKRGNHFFNPQLLQSQFDTLEVPPYALSIKINQPVETICNHILDNIK